MYKNIIHSIIKSKKAEKGFSIEKKTEVSITRALFTKYSRTWNYGMTGMSIYFKNSNNQNNTLF